MFHYFLSYSFLFYCLSNWITELLYIVSQNIPLISRYNYFSTATFPFSCNITHIRFILLRKTWFLHSIFWVIISGSQGLASCQLFVQEFKKNLMYIKQIFLTKCIHLYNSKQFCSLKKFWSWFTPVDNNNNAYIGR